MLNFLISILEILLYISIGGIEAGLSVSDWNWSGALIAVFVLIQTLFVTIKVMISSGKEPIVDPFKKVKI